ncbi:MAG: SNF2 helicase associated domain-containing protein [Romboutsia sp.]|uniref:DEAD/DEAH box helicase n=1 Tax=Romboutsia sp. TaxID=1965302 RepID=UPI003F2CD446
MDFKEIQDLIKLKSDSSRWLRGIKYFNRRLVDHVTFNINETILSFEGICESEYYNEVYPSSISIDINEMKIIQTRCTCDDFRAKSLTNSFFICKHLAATSIYGLQLAKREYANNTITSIKAKENIVKVPTQPNKQLLFYFDDSKYEYLNLEINLIIENNKISADFKIGQDKMYVLKNIKDFAYAKSNTCNLEYGKNFTYNPNIHSFREEHEKLIDLVENYGNNLASYLSISNPKMMYIGKSEFKVFLECLKETEFTLTFNNEVYNPKIINDSLPVSFELKNDEGKIKLESCGDLPIPLTDKGDVLLFDNSIYLLFGKDSHNYAKLYLAINENNCISFEKEDTQGVLSNLVPKISQFCNKVNIDDEIKNNIISDFNTKFYFDLKGTNIVCNLKFIYNDENGSKFILNDIEKENIIKAHLTSLGFSFDNKFYLFKGNDTQLYDLLNKEIRNLKDFGDVYYSDKFKSRKIYNASYIQASLNEGVGGYLEFSFDIEDINKNEYKDIILAFKENSKFYKLKNGNFLNLQEQETKDFFELIDNLDLLNNEDVSKIHNSKVFYLNDMLENKNLNFITGKDLVKDVSTKFEDIKTLKLDIPKSLNATLRDYQVSGLNWFNTLNHYEFGGILADEMGLGKTLQAISFLLSKKSDNCKSIIITPTSLIYNWKNEFDTFAPTMKVLLVHGNKKEREKALQHLDDYDVVITTYGTLRNDLDIYDKKTFDYCIIDEAQNIKNPLALSTEAVKSVKAKVKFALTGTPIENNLVELWSIFDFVMPGYLYSKNRFQDLFLNSDNNSYNLKKLIKPFILRRTKSEVMKELPEKIEKKFFIELNKDQRKIYSSYISELNEKLKDKDLKKDRIVIFSYLTKLRQLCLDPKVILEDYNKRSSKIDTTIELLKDYIDNGHKILLFSQFTSVLGNLGKELKKNKITYSYIDGQTPAKDRLDLVDKFNSCDDNKVFLISLKAGGTGLNLTSADIVIHFDPWWNPSVENQASDRAHRYGQKNSVEVIKLIAKGTIEEKIIKLQESKNNLIEEFINGDLSNQNVLRSLSDKEIIDLFS